MSFENLLFNDILLGAHVHGAINEEFIFRVRGGNGYFGSVIGKTYQDKYPYFIPKSINNVQGEAARVKFGQAVYSWKHSIPEEAKKSYNDEATHRGGMSGFNLYIKKFMNDQI